MQAKSQAILTGETVYRWLVKTSEGWKITWAPTKDAAKTKCEKTGLRVSGVRPLRSMERPPA